MAFGCGMLTAHTRDSGKTTVVRGTALFCLSSLTQREPFIAPAGSRHPQILVPFWMSCVGVHVVFVVCSCLNFWTRMVC